MSRIGATTSLADPELMSFDTEFWRESVAQASHPDVDQWAADNTIGLMWLLVPSDRPDEAQDAEERGWRYMDVRVELEREPVPLDRAPSVRLLRLGDLEPLVEIARQAHRVTRFYADPTLPDERCDDLYEAWIRSSAGGWAEAVFVAEWWRRPVGYITVHADEERAWIGLIAVAENARQHGFGEQLVRSALGYADECGLPSMTVVTQGRNVGAQRLFQKCGFRTCRTDLWFHKRFS